MKTLVIYDSVNGNTAAVADSIAAALGIEAKVVSAQSAGADVRSAKRIIVGSPTLGGRPTESMAKFLDEELKRARGVSFAAFDTRISSRLAGMFGYAAVRMSEVLVKNGGMQIAEPEGFIVKGRRGPLEEGELERAADWARKLAAQ
jgi:flavodoxin I